MKPSIIDKPIPYFAANAAVLFVAIIAVYYGADWWGLNKAPIWPGARLLLLRVNAALMLAFAGATLVCWLTWCGRRAHAFFAGWTIAALLLFAAIWPGYLISDSASALKYSMEFPFNLWLGFFTPFQTAAVLQLVPHIGAITAFQLLMATAVFAYACETIAETTGKASYALLFAAVIVLSPALVYNLGLQSRDTLFSLIVLWLAVFVVRLAHRRFGGIGMMLLAGGIAGLAAGVRSGDGWFVLLPLVVIVPWLVRSRRLSGAFLGAAAAVAVVFAIVLPPLLGDPGDAFGYKVANTVNPIGYVMQNKFATDYGKNLDEIAKVVNTGKIRELQTPYEIAAWWSGGLIVEGASPEQRDAYMRHVSGYLRENIGIFMAGRVQTFAAATGLSEGGFKIDDLYGANWPAQWIVPAKYNVDLAAGRPFPRLAAAAKAWFDRSAQFDPRLASGSALFWNILPWIALLLGVICFGPRVPGLRLAALLVFTRVPLIFLTAPASQFKYYLPVVLCGGFILALAVPGLLRKQPGAQPAPAAATP